MDNPKQHCMFRHQRASFGRRIPGRNETAARRGHSAPGDTALLQTEGHSKKVNISMNKHLYYLSFICLFQQKIQKNIYKLCDA